MKTTNYKNMILHIILISFILLTIYPIVFAISNSFKELSEAFTSTLSLIPEKFTLENYTGLFDSIPIAGITINTLITASVITIAKVATSFLAAYAIVYYQFKFKNVTYFALICTIFIPFTVTMIPNYLIISELGLQNNIWGVILPQMADAIGIFMLTQSMKGIPKSLIEAAKLDNIPTKYIMKDHILPMVKPAVTSTSIWFFILAWNEYVWPVLILKTTENFTLPLALQLYISSEGGTNFTVAMALSVITMAIPLGLYLIFQKHIINTFTTSGIK
ncbi:MAG TPA: carbohydrate ABC transporter permease [Bacillales bacterium]|nr:carbohydrate ABC transporter permease [Bacillales bacterium]